MFVGLQIGMMVSGIDGTIVATALPSIVRDLGGVSGIAWVVTAYLLFQVATMPLYGKIGDVYGRKRVLLFAIGLFMLGSMACGLAQTMPELLVARAVQGLGGGGLPVLGMAILGDLIPPRQLGRWLGYQGMLFAVAVIVGSADRRPVRRPPELALGVLHERPFVLVSVSILIPRLHLPHRRIEHSIDYLGSALLTVGARRARGAGDRGRQGRRLGVAGVGSAGARAGGVRSRRSCGGSGTPPSRSCPSGCSRTRCCGSPRR